MKGGLPAKVILLNRQCPGDILMLTAAVRDFKKSYPDVDIDVRTPWSHLWKNNPHIVPLAARDALMCPVGYKTPHQSPDTWDKTMHG